MTDDDYVRRSWRLRRDEPISLVPGHVSQILFERFDLRGLMRIARERDPQLYDVLLSMYEDTLEVRGCASETNQPQPAEDLEQIVQDMITPPKAAALLSISPQAVRKAIREGRLPGEQIGSQVLVRMEDVEHYREERRRRGAA